MLNFEKCTVYRQIQNYCLDLSFKVYSVIMTDLFEAVTLENESLICKITKCYQFNLLFTEAASSYFSSRLNLMTKTTGIKFNFVCIHVLFPFSSKMYIFISQCFPDFIFVLFISLGIGANCYVFLSWSGVCHWQDLASCSFTFVFALDLVYISI